MIRVGLIGFGYWGPNLARSFASHPGIELAAIAEHSEKRQAIARLKHRDAKIIADGRALIDSSDIDAVVIATPPTSHFEIAEYALQKKKNVFVAKPLTLTSAHAATLSKLAQQNGVLLAVDQTYLFHDAVRKLKELIGTGALGELYYYDSVRINLGLIQGGANVMWDLAAHDLSILDYLMETLPLEVTATAMSYHANTPESIGYVSLRYPNNFMAHIHVNWLSPIKIRRTMIGASKKMVVWDDMLPDEKFKIYDRGVDITTEPQQGYHDIRALYRVGDMHSPQISAKEALVEEVEHFVDCLEGKTKPLNGARLGGRVVALLECIELSVRNQGVIVRPAEVVDSALRD